LAGPTRREARAPLGLAEAAPSHPAGARFQPDLRLTMPDGFALDRPVGSVLFPSGDDRQRYENGLTQALIEAADRVAQGSVAPDFDPALFKRALARFDFAMPLPLDSLLGWTVAQLEHGVTHMTHPRYFGLFNPAPTFPAECADRIAAAFNPQLATATTSPAAVEIEAHVIAAVASRAGLPDVTEGHFTTGGAEANFTGLICALTAANGGFAEYGARAFAGQPALYISRESHLAWFKIAHQAGIGRAAVRLIATDGMGRLDPAALKVAVAEDRAAGIVPVMIVATAGTTNAGMIDPLAACAKIAQREKVWFHVDAAWGGAVIASDRHRGALAGIETADSLTIDAHKWFAVTMGCGMFFTQRLGVLPAAFHVVTGYMPSHNAGHDPYLNSVQWSRRFLGLRLFLSLAAAGWAGYARHVEHSIELAALLEEKLLARGWRVANASPVGVLCIEPPAGSPEPKEIVRRVLASGEAWISTATFEARPVIRACVTHGKTSAADIDILVAALEAAVGL
jgi:glutamate/tyrosine decarboxylase-like PLP-dependent enzyme